MTQKRQMKDSGITWAKNIPKHWEVMPNKYIMKKVKKICDIHKDEDIISLSMNGVIVRDLDAGGKMPTTFNGYQYVYPGNLLMCLFDYDVTPRCIGFINNFGITSPAYSQFEMLNGNNAKYYFYYYLMIDDTKSLLHLTKNLRHSFTEDELGRINQIVPPLQEQQKIAELLDKECGKIDEASAEIEKQIETLEELKRSIISEAVTKGLNKSAQMKDSGVEYCRSIPNHWKITRIKNLGEYRNGLTYTPDTICEESEGTLVLRSSNIQKGKLCFKDNVYVKKTIPYEMKAQKGDILICSRNGSKELIGKNAIIDNINASFGAFMMIYRSIDSKFMYYVLNSSIFSYYLGSFFTSTINQLTGQNFGDMKVPFCYDKSEREIIVKYLDKKCAEIDFIIEEKNKQLEVLEKYKKSLIYEYVTGKKEVV